MERRTYAAMVASLDESIGNITNALKTAGMFDNSVIVFTTDNGGAPAGFDWFVNTFIAKLNGKICHLS